MQQSISWQSSVPIFKTGVIVKQLGFAVGIPFGLIALFIGLTSGKSNDTIYALGLVGALLFLSWIFVLLVYGGRYQVEFVLDEKVVLCRTQPKQHRINRTINTLTVMLGLLSGKPSVAGAGMLAESRQEVFLQWQRISKVKRDPRRQIIILWSGRMEQIALFCTRDNYLQVEQFVLWKTQQHNEVEVE
ncbi:MAG: hypothetical protein ACRKFN_14650 [Desulfitobacterium sp.]